MIFPIKKEELMLQEMLLDLINTTEITNISPGSIARSMLEVVNRKLHTAYLDLDTYASMLFLSTANGEALDLIGHMLNCRRLRSESDNNYRYRISQQVFTAATGNETAIRLKCLSIDKVKDIVITRYTRGSGSFTVHVITDEIDTPKSVLDAVSKVVRESKAEGIRAVVEKPIAVPIDIGLSVTLNSKVRTESAGSIQAMALDKVETYLDSIQMGGEISIQKLISAALALDEVSQVFLTSLSLNGEQVVVREILKLEYNQRPYIRNITIKEIN